MKLPAPIKIPARWLLEPHALTGLGRTLPMGFWAAYANWRGLAAPTGLPESSSSATYTAEFFRKHLLENLLPFWAEHSIDTARGGYISHLDQQGRVYDPDTRYTAMQARLIYAFSIGHSLAPQRGYLQLAQHGVEFLQRVWDGQQAGWFQGIDVDGQVLIPLKNGFDQAYALIGLTEFYRVSRDPRVLQRLQQAYQAIERYSWQPQQLGYLESFTPDWQVQSNKKTICIQLDMLRAVLGLFAITGEETYRQRAIQLGDVIVENMCDPDHGCALEIFHPDWRYAPVRTRDQIWSGHNLKGAWLLLRLDSIAPDQRYVQAAIRMIDYCLKYAWDSQQGGFYQFIYRTGRLASPAKLWWPQTEGLNALLALYQKTGELLYRRAFDHLADFIFTCFADAQYGEWYTSCQPDGKPLDDHKGGRIKSAYHTVQACLEAARMLNTVGVK